MTQAARACGLDERAVYAVQLAVDEACSNIIEYAYVGVENGTIECECNAGDDGFTVVLRDTGEPFDPACVPEPDLTCDLASRQTGGLGVYFIYRLMDEVRFERTPDDRNILTLFKRRTPSP